MQLFLCMRVDTIIFCFIMYGYSCAQIWLLLCQHYVTPTQLLNVTCSVVYRVLIAHIKIALHGYEKEPVIDKQHKDPSNCILTIIITDTAIDFSLRQAT